MSKHYLQEKITGTQGQVVGFDASGNAVAQAAPQTGYSKTETLQDATKVLFGLTSAAVPDDVFAWLGDLGNKYVWAKQQETVVLTDISVTSDINLANDVGVFRYSSSVENDGTGKAVLVNPQTTGTIQKTLQGAQTLAALAPCYIESRRDGTVYYLPSGTTAGTANSDTIKFSTYHYLSRNATIKAKSVSFAYQTVCYVLTQTNTPPVEQGYTFDFCGQLGGKAQIATGSYVGTGTYQYQNENVVSSDFDIKFAIVFFSNVGIKPLNLYWNLSFIWIKGQKYGSVNSENSVTFNLLNTNAKELHWYSNSGADQQLNASGATYFYILFG